MNGQWYQIWHYEQLVTAQRHLRTAYDVLLFCFRGTSIFTL